MMAYSMSVRAAASGEESEPASLRENCRWKIPVNLNDFKILTNQKSQLHEILKKKFGCKSTLISPTLESNSKCFAQPVFRRRLTPGLELSVWKDDLSRHAVDIVVNAANGELRHGGGLAWALVKAGGPEIQEESRRYVATRGTVPTGGIAVTGAGKLPCRNIIHAVGPQWKAMDRQRCIDQLQNAIKNILEYVINASVPIKTVAIPALSSGIFGFPLDLCTQTILKTIKSYCQIKQGVGNLEEIHLVSNEDPTVAAFKGASEAILGGPELGFLNSQATTHAFSTALEYRSQGVTLQVVQGHIEQQKTDVIVNFIFPHSFKGGTVSRSIIQQAGDKIELELNSKLSKPFQWMVVTGGFKLLCRYVYHVMWYLHYSNHMILKNAMKECLNTCLEQNITSISFPVLEPEIIAMEKETLAQIMFDEVLTFSIEHLNKQLTVKFVIFPSHLEIHNAFKTKMSNLKMLSSNSHSAPQRNTEEQRQTDVEPGSPAIILEAVNKEDIHEAKTWIQRLLTLRDHHIIENNHIFYLGKKEHDILSQLQKTSRVSISEMISLGKAILEIKGSWADRIEVVLNIEQMLCDVQEEMVRKKERGLWRLTRPRTDQPTKKQEEMREKIIFLRYPVPLLQDRVDQRKQFENCGLRVIKVEAIENVILMTAFQRKKELMEGRARREPVSHRLFQQVPHQFLNEVCRIGFQRLISAPCDPKYGAGIYFTKNLKNLADKVKETSTTDELIYVFEAEVLTGSFCQGHQLNIVPPPLSPGAIDGHDSTVNSVSAPEIFVIFSSTQALPLYLWTCTQDHVRSQEHSSGAMVLSSQQPWTKFPNGSPVD